MKRFYLQHKQNLRVSQCFFFLKLTFFILHQRLLKNLMYKKEFIGFCKVLFEWNIHWMTVLRTFSKSKSLPKGHFPMHTKCSWESGERKWERYRRRQRVTGKEREIGKENYSIWDYIRMYCINTFIIWYPNETTETKDQVNFVKNAKMIYWQIQMALHSYLGIFHVYSAILCSLFYAPFNFLLQ